MKYAITPQVIPTQKCQIETVTFVTTYADMPFSHCVWKEIREIKINIDFPQQDSGDIIIIPNSAKYIRQETLSSFTSVASLHSSSI